MDAVTGESNTGNNCSAAVSITVATVTPPSTGTAKLYWTDWGTDKIQRADLDGSNVEDLVSGGGLDGPDGLALEMAGGKIYWTDAGAAKIQRADLDGSNVEDLVTSGLSVPYGLAIDVSGGKMYWTDRQNGKIQRADLDGSNAEDLLTLAGLAFPGEIALDAANGKMYWTNPGADKIQRADLDGSNVEDLLTSADGLVDPSGLAVGAVSGSSGRGNYGVGDALPNFPSGFFVPKLLQKASLTISGGRAVLSFQNGGLIELQDGTRYTCVSAGGCSIEGGRVTLGVFK